MSPLKYSSILAIFILNFTPIYAKVSVCPLQKHCLGRIDPGGRIVSVAVDIILRPEVSILGASFNTDSVTVGNCCGGGGKGARLKGHGSRCGVVASGDPPLAALSLAWIIRGARGERLRESESIGSHATQDKV